MNSFMRLSSIGDVARRLLSQNCTYNDESTLNCCKEDASLEANHLLRVTSECADAVSTECMANATAQISSLGSDYLEKAVTEGPSKRVDFSDCLGYDSGSFHVRFVEPTVDVYDFLAHKGFIDPEDEGSWQFLYRNQHPSFGICSYCLEMEDKEIYSRQRRQIASELVKIMQWDTLETVESVIGRAETKADEFVEQLKVQAKKSDQERCIREYQLYRVDSLDEYTIAKMIPGLDAELVKQEWDEYLLNMSKNVQTELRRKRLRKKLVKLLRLGF
ncbi:hypothetical protein V1525DRAFT_356199 [Lipomyces kononenkoae]|uniref:Uncharacterized protein n=1 Tax=Lipomyces kononenkoae TaxID=34357 RepID=A0ACC3T6I1_LIPKO